MVGRFDSKKQEMNIVSIPRDTCANVYYGYVSSKKISAVYGIGGGIDALMEAVSDMVGFNIDSYIIVNIKAFTALVDTLGGVYFDIPYNMNYDDPTQDLYIHFKSGYQYLTGADAVKVVRWRQNSDGTVYGDIERINIQQNFLKTVAKQCMSLSNILTKFDDYLNIFKTYVNTDMTINNLAWYGQNFLKLKTEDIKFYTMPSKYNDSIKGFSYGTLYTDEWVKMVNDYLNPYEEDITESDMNIITRDEKGNLYATKGEIAGGYESFLDYKEYIASLKKEKNSGNSGNTDKKDTPTDTASSDNNSAAQTETDVQSSVTNTGNENTDAQAENTSSAGADTGESGTDTGGEASESDLGLFYTGGDTGDSD
jgi:LCP family protein required for cell wall assembly